MWLKTVFMEFIIIVSTKRKRQAGGTLSYWYSTYRKSWIIIFFHYHYKRECFKIVKQINSCASCLHTLTVAWRRRRTQEECPSPFCSQP